MCRQQYSYRRLIAGNGDSEEEEVDLFKAPSGYQCFTITSENE